MNQGKFENVALFIRENAEGEMTDIRLAKLLWLVDKTAYLCLARTITEALYRRKRYGPVPDGLDALSGPAVRQGTGADITIFDENEMKVLRKVMREYGKTSCEDLVKLSHDLSWATREDGEVIPFESYLSDVPNADSNPAIRSIIAREEAEYATCAG